MDFPMKLIGLVPHHYTNLNFRRMKAIIIILLCITYFQDSVGQSPAGTNAPAGAQLDEELVRQLEDIYTEDQKYRLQVEEVEKKHGWKSKEMQELWKVISRKDSVNLRQVRVILDQRGWLGPDVVGNQGNTTLFLVIQHADSATQKKYLPMMREAVKNGKAQASDLALLEDRVALAQGKKQIYGSQIHIDSAGKYFIAPIEDEANVNKRRASVGLSPLEDYVKMWNIQYKLPKK